MIIWAASPAGHEWENGDVIIPGAMEKAMDVGFTNRTLTHEFGGPKLGTVMSVKKIKGGYEYDLELNDAGRQLMADIRKGPAPSISEVPRMSEPAPQEMRHCPDCGRYMADCNQEQIGVGEHYLMRYEGICAVHGKQSVTFP